MKTPAFIFLAAALAVTSAPAGAEAISVSRQDCLGLVRHAPAPGVAYRRGVDVDGNPVTPAETSGNGAVAPPRTFTIDITVDIAKRLGLPADPSLFQGEAKIGTVTFRDGRAWFNGQPLSTGGQKSLAAMCRERIR